MNPKIYPITNFLTGKDYCRSCKPEGCAINGDEILTTSQTGGEPFAYCCVCHKRMEVPAWQVVFPSKVVEHTVARIF